MIGAAVAYYLVQRGYRPTIVEKDAVASGASGAAAGLISPSGPDLGPLTEITALGFGMHAELARTLPDESGVEYGYRLTPRVLVAKNDDEAVEGRALAAQLPAAPASGGWLDAEELNRRTGWVDRVEVGGVELPSLGQLDPYRFTLALVTAAERRGATVRSGTVDGMRVEDGRVTGVSVGGRMRDADIVVLAAGPWSAVIEQWTDVRIPVTPLKGQIVKVRPSTPLGQFCVTNAGNYCLTKDDGIVYIGTTEEEAGFDVSITVAARDEILKFGLGLSSAFESAEFVEQTACLRPLSADGLPIIGPLAGIEGAYVATGHGRQGILMAPPTGRAISDLIADGSTDRVDLSRFDPMRFTRGEGARTD